MPSTCLNNKKIKSVEKNNVFSSLRTVRTIRIRLRSGLQKNTRLKMEGRKFLSLLPKESFPIVFFDPQYRGILNKMRYGNEGKSRGKKRCTLPQMQEADIVQFIKKINNVLIPSGHLFLWMDKYHLCQGFSNWLVDTSLGVVDLITWNKQKMGMGYRTRRISEYLVILQKKPKKAKGVWKLHNIRDVWEEPIENKNRHTHRKPVALQSQLIRAVSNEGDIIVDPAAGSFSVMESARCVNRHFVGCDLNG